MSRDNATLDLFALDLFDSAPEPTRAPVAPIEPARPMPPAINDAETFGPFTGAWRRNVILPEANLPHAEHVNAWLEFAESTDVGSRYDDPVDTWAAHKFCIVYESKLYEPFLSWTDERFRKYREFSLKIAQLNEKDKAKRLAANAWYEPRPAALSRCAPHWFYHAAVSHDAPEFIERLTQMLRQSDDELAKTRSHIPDWTPEAEREHLRERLAETVQRHAEDEERARLTRLASVGYTRGTLDRTPCLRCGATAGLFPERPWCIVCDFVISDPFAWNAPVAPKGYDHPAAPPRFSGWDEYAGPAWIDVGEDPHFSCKDCGGRCNRHGVCIACLDRERASRPPERIKRPKSPRKKSASTQQPETLL